MDALQVRDLRYRHRGDWSLRATETLKGISFSVKQGELFGFLGHNGAGKTTTIKCILGLICPSAGEIFIQGKKAGNAATRRHIGYLAEQPYFYDHLTVEETMVMYARLAGVGSNDIPSRVTTALIRVNIEAKRHSKMRTLSKGLTQRVAMAQAIVGNPEILILDEPFSGLDPLGRREFRELIAELHRSGTTILMCTHVLSDVEYLCSRVSIMARGELKGVYELNQLPTVQESYELTIKGDAATAQKLLVEPLRSKQSNELYTMWFERRDVAEKALQAALSSKLEIRSFEAHSGSLEDLFVQLVSFEEGA